MSIKKDTIIRTFCLVLALINQALTLAGKSPLPIEDAQVTEILSLIFTMAASIWAWWKNNSFTKAAIQADDVKEAIKNGKTVEVLED